LDELACRLPVTNSGFYILDLDFGFFSWKGERLAEPAS
jgi:hypothetical protein